MNKVRHKCLFSEKDIDVISEVIACIARGDRDALAAMIGVEVSAPELLWSTVKEAGETFIEPPENFFNEWDLQYLQSAEKLFFEGPLWSVEMQASDWHLYLEKDCRPDTGKIVIRRMGST